MARFASAVGVVLASDLLAVGTIALAGLLMLTLILRNWPKQKSSHAASLTCRPAVFEELPKR